MGQLIEIKYSIDSIVDYPRSETKLIADTRHDTFDINGNPLQVYYKQQQIPTPIITVGNVAKNLQEINNKWREDNNNSWWGISREGNLSVLSISGEFYDNNHAIYFIGLCERFIKDVFHL